MPLSYFDQTMRFYRGENRRPAYGPRDLDKAQEVVDEWNACYAEQGESYELFTKQGVHHLRLLPCPALQTTEPEDYHITICKVCGEATVDFGEGSDLCFHCDVCWDKDHSDRWDVTYFLNEETAKSHPDPSMICYGWMSSTEHYPLSDHNLNGIIRLAREKMAETEQFKAARIVKRTACVKRESWFINMDHREKEELQ